MAGDSEEKLRVEAVNADTIEEAVRTDRKGFADSQAEPDAEELRRRLRPKVSRLSRKRRRKSSPKASRSGKK
jgi:hypothetical protein